MSRELSVISTPLTWPSVLKSHTFKLPEKWWCWWNVRKAGLFKLLFSFPLAWKCICHLSELRAESYTCVCSNCNSSELNLSNNTKTNYSPNPSSRNRKIRWAAARTVETYREESDFQVRIWNQTWHFDVCFRVRYEDCLHVVVSPLDEWMLWVCLFKEKVTLVLLPINSETYFSVTSAHYSTQQNTSEKITIHAQFISRTMKLYHLLSFRNHVQGLLSEWLNMTQRSHHLIG